MPIKYKALQWLSNSATIQAANLIASAEEQQLKITPLQAMALKPAAVLFMLLTGSLVVVVHSQEGSCSSSRPCPTGMCCSKWGYCGTTPAYCGGGSSPPPSASPSLPPSGAPAPRGSGGGGRHGKGQVAVYWGQNGNEGRLIDACNSGNYQVVLLSFLTSYGNFQPPQLNLAGHCDPYSNACTVLSSQIQACQSKGIKVMLSIGGGDSGGRLVSDDDAKDLAHRVWNSFLGGEGASRPLGAAVLDGIDLDVEAGATPDRYAVLVRTLRSIAGGHKVLVSAAPQCPFPDANLGSAVQTPGLFDYLFVQFYNNPPCAYDGSSSSKLIQSWKQWTSSIPTAKIFLGLPAAPAAAGSGFVPADVLKSSVLPAIKSTVNYGGVMLWSVYYDQTDSYSGSIRSGV